VRDYDRRKAIPPEYPPSPFMEIEHPLWSLETQRAFLKKRLELHQKAEENIKQRGTKRGIKKIPQCTSEEMWEKSPTYAVKTKDRKTAWRILNTFKEAEQWIENHLPQDMKKKVFIETRPGEKIRCEHYCLVAKVCNEDLST